MRLFDRKKIVIVAVIVVIFAGFVGYLSVNSKQKPYRFLNGEHEKRLLKYSTLCSEMDSLTVAFKSTEPFSWSTFEIRYILNPDSPVKVFAKISQWPERSPRDSLSKLDSVDTVLTKFSGLDSVIRNIRFYRQDSTSSMVLDGVYYEILLCEKRSDQVVVINTSGKLKDTPNANSLLDSFGELFMQTKVLRNDIGRKIMETSNDLRSSELMYE